jgi:hypothetical protein
VITVFMDEDGTAKERFVHHNAGHAGRGGSSYIDSVAFRDRDANTAWTSSTDGTREERRYLFQNWRQDVSALMTDVGKPGATGAQQVVTRVRGALTFRGRKGQRHWFSLDSCGPAHRSAV